MWKGEKTTARGHHEAAPHLHQKSHGIAKPFTKQENANGGQGCQDRPWRQQDKEKWIADSTAARCRIETSEKKSELLSIGRAQQIWDMCVG